MGELFLGAYGHFWGRRPLQEKSLFFSKGSSIFNSHIFLFPWYLHTLLLDQCTCINLNNCINTSLLSSVPTCNRWYQVDLYGVFLGGAPSFDGHFWRAIFERVDNHFLERRNFQDRIFLRKVKAKELHSHFYSCLYVHNKCITSFVLFWYKLPIPSLLPRREMFLGVDLTFWDRRKLPFWRHFYKERGEKREGSQGRCLDPHS